MTLHVQFDDPDHGWIGISIQQQDNSFAESFSYAGYDSLRELVRSLGLLLKAETTSSVTCLIGPAEFDLRFERNLDVIQFTVVVLASHRRLQGTGESAFSASGSFEQICVPFWRALRELESRFNKKELAERWHREFPHDELCRLSKRIRSLKR